MKYVNNGNFAVLYNLKKPLKILKLQIPKCESNQLLVKIKYTFICGSQLNEIFGKKGKDNYLPHLLGHEASGYIVNKGKNVDKFKLKDKVFLSWIKNTNTPSDLPKYFLKNKKINSGQISTFSEYVVINQNNVYKVPKSLDLKLASLFGCAVPTGFGVVKNNIKNLEKTKYIGIYGFGGIGLMAILALNYFGFKKIYIVDKNIKNLNIAKKLFKNVNICHVKNKKINLRINKKDIQLNFEFSGNTEMMKNAFENIYDKGKCVIAGNPPFGDNLKLNPYDLIFGKNIDGFAGNNISIKKNLNLFVKIINFHKKKNFSKFFKLYELKNINLAINDFKNGKVIRPLIKFN